MKPDQSSLYRKYVISKANGQPVDPKADYFVLRLDTDPAARAAAYIYAREVEKDFPELAQELIDRCERYDFGGPSLEPDPVNAQGSDRADQPQPDDGKFRVELPGSDLETYERMWSDRHD